MGEWVRLKAEDGHELSAYVAKPAQAAVGCVLILQEIFGVNPYIQSVVDGYALEGYLTIAPALFDRVERGVELKYEGPDWPRGLGLMQKLDTTEALKDIAAAYTYLETSGKGIGVVGFCYGGRMAWLTATRGEDFKMRPDCCVGYYAGGIGALAAEEPSCPVMLHFGAADTHIGPEQVEAVRTAHPDVEIFVYEGAEHGFSCHARSSYNEGAARIARGRTLEFLKTHLA